MQIGGIGGGPGPNWGQDWGVPLAGKHPQQIANDLIAGALAQLATHELVSILMEIEDRRLTVQPDVAAAAVREVTTAVQQGHVAEALAKINMLARSTPGVIEALNREPALEAIRPQVEALLKGIAAERKQVLEPALARAAELVENRGPVPLGNDGTDTAAMIAVAMRFIETGRIQDLVRAEELVSVVMKAYRPRTAGALGAEEESNWLVRGANWTARLWLRAPLLILLVGWLLLGLFGVISLKWLGTGLLALVALGFYSRIRHIRF